MNAILLTASLFLQAPPEAPKSFYDFTMPDIDGYKRSMKIHKGKVVMVVNTATFCALTPQYAGLEKLYQKYKKDGFVIVAFPANNFRNQEPGTNAEIKEFCTTEYNVTFPLMSKVNVMGEKIVPLYKWLVAQSDRPRDEIEWNFAKFILDRKGKVIKRFKPEEDPHSRWITSAIEKALKQKA